MRIPLSQLRFPDIDGKKTWGYDLVRVYPRDRTQSQLLPVPGWEIGRSGGVEAEPGYRDCSYDNRFEE
jgi:hypothetical protein